MDKAKAAVSSILSKAGHHDTTTHESTNPAVQRETIHEQRREEKQVARDREVHQDHYHTTVQPVKDHQVLPEQHHHKQAEVQHVTHDHRNHGETKERLHQGAAQFQNESVRAPTQHHTATTAPEVAGEHVHHHVHETIQPVIHKQTIEPHVTHTTVPVHETIHNKAQHHSATTLPAMDMADFKKQGGSLTGHHERHDHVKGEPTTIGATGHHPTGQDHVGHQGHHGQTNSSGVGQGIGSGAVQHSTHHDNHTDNHHTKTTKPSLMDKLNPKIDADGDGKKGFMS